MFNASSKPNLKRNSSASCARAYRSFLSHIPPTELPPKSTNGLGGIGASKAKALAYSSIAAEQERISAFASSPRFDGSGVAWPRRKPRSSKLPIREARLHTPIPSRPSNGRLVQVTAAKRQPPTKDSCTLQPRLCQKQVPSSGSEDNTLIGP